MQEGVPSAVGGLEDALPPLLAKRLEGGGWGEGLSVNRRRSRKSLFEFGPGLFKNSSTSTLIRAFERNQGARGAVPLPPPPRTDGEGAHYWAVENLRARLWTLRGAPEITGQATNQACGYFPVPAPTEALPLFAMSAIL